jgi:hypothetical protein
LSNALHNEVAAAALLHRRDGITIACRGRCGFIAILFDRCCDCRVWQLGGRLISAEIATKPVLRQTESLLIFTVPGFSGRALWKTSGNQTI